MKLNTFHIPFSYTSLDLWLSYIEKLHYKNIDLNLERISKIAIKLGLLNPAKFIIKVGGTNGKGTTCCFLESMLIASGKSVGVYSSPHLLHYTERVRIQGKELSEKKHIESMSFIEHHRENTPLTFFEFCTLSALYIFCQSNLEFVILEVGLGGRLDATNIISSNISVITNVNIDHVDLLGKSRSSIAFEKAGIFHFGKPAIVGDKNRPIELDLESKKIGSILYARNRDWWFKIVEKNKWDWWDKFVKIESLPIPKFLPLENAATALATARYFPFILSKKAIYKGLINAYLPGRFQFIQKSPVIILDVAHNPHAANYLANQLSKIYCTGKIRALVGMLSDKDISGSISCLHNLIDVWYCTSLNVPRAASASDIAKYAKNDIKQFNSVKIAWNHILKDSKSEDCILVYGSFYTVSAVMKLLKN